MNKMDLRQVGTITGLPIYVDFASLPDYKEDGETLSVRDNRERLIHAMLRKAFNMQTDEPE